jgi:hypothetical protein
MNQTAAYWFQLKRRPHERCKEGIMLCIPLSTLLVGIALFVVPATAQRTPLPASSLPSNPRISGAPTK